MSKLAAMIVVFAACGGGGDSHGTLAAIQAKHKITYGADLQGGEPYLYMESGHLVGFETELMDAIAKRLGVEAEMVQTNWSNLVDSLDRGDFDIIFNGLEATGKAADRILLSAPYFVYAETLAVRRDSPARYIFDLVGKRVGSLNQTYAWDILNMLPVEAKPYEGNDEPYNDLEAGRIDGVLLDNIIAERFGCVSKRPQVMCLKADVERGTYVAGIRKSDPDVKRAIDDALAAMRADGELERILRKANLWDHRQTDNDVGVSVADPRVRTFDLDMFGEFVRATGVTLEISILGFLLAVPIGLLLAVARVYGNIVARVIARGYIELFRGTPVLLQLYVMYYTLGYVIRLDPITVAVLTLGLNYGAYEAEVYRGALLAIPRGQSEAAKALGLGAWQTLRHVLLPQALRIALPPMTNDFVSLLKDSSIVSIITVIELTKRMTIAAVDLRGYLVAGIACALFYLALSVPLSELARRLERRLARDQRPHAL